MSALPIPGHRTLAERTVLIVGNDEDVYNTIWEIATKRGWRLVRVDDNDQALARARDTHFDLIVTGTTTSVQHDVRLLRDLRTVHPHMRLIILTDESIPEDVILAMRERAFSYFSKPVSHESLAEIVNIALVAPCWDDGIEVVSATPALLTLLVRGDKSTAERLLQFVSEIADLPEGEKHDVGLACRELLLNAIEHGANFDPAKYVEVSYIRAERMVSCRIKDPGPGFSVSGLAHAAISNPPDNPIAHALHRESAGLRPGGYGILMAQSVVDELIYGEHGNDVVLVKYLGRRPGHAARSEQLQAEAYES